jgi:hypothetical protein
MPFILVILVFLFLPVLCGLMYRWGGADQWPQILPFKQKIFRAAIGVPIALCMIPIAQSWWPVLCILTYWFQPPYGENSYLNFLGEYGKFAVCGFVFGVSSTPAWYALGFWWMGLVQGLISLVAYVVIKYLDDKNIVKNPWVERLRGYFGTVTL